jgi:hypothetical protein
MSEAFRMYLLHSDEDLSCIGPARARNVAPFRMHVLYFNSVPNEPAHRSPREEHMRMTLKPSSFKLMVGIRVRTPKVAALWRGVKNTSTRASMLMTSLKRSVLQTARMGLVRRWMRRERAKEKVAAVRRGVISRVRTREKDAAVRRGVILRRRRVMRKVTRMRKRVTSRYGVRCMKVSRIRARETRRGYDETVFGYDKTVRCARFQGSVLVKRVTDTTRPSLRKVSSVATLFIIIIPGVSAVVGCV